ncbi:conserved hypothetical protein [uncultured Eubacteriales bacterium]|uniref:Uncharacterized protein n=1 Tax=uncultured Eubacteriales bacterium TaxID=172733 RepID=A0A212J4G7_9FIRM|nr:conserved hypothetical protein [uncultured Eubacteriales bacterium]
MGFGNPSIERAAIEATYEDKAAVLRVQDVQDGSLTRQEETTVYQAVSCGLSRGGGDSSGQTAMQNNIDYDATLFLAPELDIRPGDRVEVTRFGVMHSFSVEGRTAVYATHQEARLKERGLA